MAESTKHTPGPWAWDGGCLMSQQSYTAVVLWYTSDDDGVHCRPADRPLIAAAPELLAACKAALALLANLTSEEFARGGDRPARMALADAIARAEGGAS